MFASRKLVPALLLLLIPTVSAAALSTCPKELPGMNNFQSQMTDMGMVSQPSGFAANESNHCCELSPAETVPAPPARASVSNETYSVLTAVVIVESSLSAATRTAYDQARIASLLPQAFLCVFLI
jgi:hypothetical protein